MEEILEDDFSETERQEYLCLSQLDKHMSTVASIQVYVIWGYVY